MASSEKSAIISKKSSFSEVVDEACERLMERQVQHSIRRIREMQNELDELERELSELLSAKSTK